MNETLHLLVVDDEVGMRLSVERALRHYSTHLPDMQHDVNFRVSQAESGEAALALIDADTPDIILLDYKLPGISGLDVLTALKERKLDILVVMITAYASLETAVQATKSGAFDFLAKPFTPEELRADRPQDDQALHGAAPSGEAGGGAAPDPLRVPVRARP